LVIDAERRRQLGRCKNKWEVNTEVDLKEIRSEGVGSTKIDEGFCEHGNEN
jgi:hypothetical protein